ncbi:MAG: hypothetical protein QOF60_1171 [Actinomycetota bacterium]|jgi:subtilisin family serine protease|nr:hypothetical protein [Actinomycetota bacterium]
MVVAAAIALGAGGPVAAEAPRSPARAGRVLVTFRDRADVRAAHAAAKARVQRRLASIATDVVEVNDVERAVAAYEGRADVVSAEADGVVHALGAPPDGTYPKQWNLQPVSPSNQGTLNWEPVFPARQGAGVLVAVVDTGIRRGGTDEPGLIRADLAKDYVNPTSGANVADDDNGHGTHIAGTIAQRTGNPMGIGTVSGPSVAGVAPAASLMPVKVLDRFGAGSVSNTAAGVLYAAAQGAKVINLSLGGDYSPTLCTAVAKAAETALVVAASGNEAEGGFVPVSYPAACPAAIGIGAVRYDGSRAPYSNAGCEVAAVAPGGDLSPTGRLFDPRVGPPDPKEGILQETYDFSPASAGGQRFGFFYDSGTSMAAAHAAGAAAVLLGINSDIVTVRRALLSNARDLGRPGPDDEFGAGALDLAAAVSAVGSNPPPPRETLGYWMVATDGGIFAFGDAAFLGSTGALRLNSPIVGMARTPTGLGYWLVAADGGIFTFGDAGFFGSTGAIRLNKPIVGMTPSGTGQGYWLVATDGGIFAFGDAHFAGSTGGLSLKSPVVGMAADRTGSGYWLVAADGGIFAFGDAPFLGSTGALKLNAPIVGMAATPTSAGYWMVATDGGIFTFGDAAFLGSTGAISLNKPIVGMAPTCYGKGYWLVASDGGVFSFGAAPFLGSTGGIVLNRPVVGMQLAIDHRSGQG